MPPSSKAPWPTRHSMPYPISLLTTLSPSSQSFSRFTQPFTPFLPGPPGAWQVPLTPSRPPPLKSPLLSSPLSSASLRHKNLPSIFICWGVQLCHLSPSFPIIDVVFSSIMLLLLESKWSTFYADHPLSTGLPWAYLAATTFSDNSLAVNVSQSSLTDGNDTVAQSSPQGENYDTTLSPTIPSIPAVPSTSAVIPPSGPPSSKSPYIPSCTLWWKNAVIFATGLASSPATNNVCSTLGVTPKWCPPSSTNLVEPILIPTPASSSKSMDDYLHPPWVISPTITIHTEPNDSGPIISSQCYICQSMEHLCPNYSHYCCLSCGQTAPGHPNYKCPELHCSHCEQHGHSHIFCPCSMFPNHDPFMDTTWDLSHYKVNEEDRSSWNETSRL